MVDYLVVGLGLAGMAFCELLEQNDRSFICVNDDSQQASVVAGGLYNPVILKRFTPAWRAKEQMEMAMPFYARLEEKLKRPLDYKLRVLRRFASVEEQNNWFQAADRPQLRPFLSLRILENHNPMLDAPFGYGEVLHTGRVDTKTLLQTYSEYLGQKGVLIESAFDFSKLEVDNKGVRYEEISARKVVFASGYGLKANPYFNYLPLNGTKGELLTIRSGALQEENVIKSSVFIIPLGEDLYRIGATYKWKDKTNTPTEESRRELLDKLGTFLKADYEVVSHVAGIRPTVTDRRPLVGRHPVFSKLYILNGFGSRGVLIAPYAASQLLAHIENGASLLPELDISRFSGRYNPN
ncbi:NAD(P)/FAD-dependent oxidoreductase [Lentiprolixibacter aurantiacus]|uniref:FAD-dependent oxidoreductase n=1 Tax=Lentiprolixibacter aurantiacus TaxID=2993939 RepID=A0AAE3MIB0_9FLAO|nr:FAD-dependent oxidoreductase [Lentiprolixibacter aurantiacus]MCX2718046.1 FAD-dependent oxidoreductase [Lentiprolixibacter aurantiacus]